MLTPVLYALVNSDKCLEVTEKTDTFSCNHGTYRLPILLPPVAGENNININIKKNNEMNYQLHRVVAKPYYLDFAC